MNIDEDDSDTKSSHFGKDSEKEPEPSHFGSRGYKGDDDDDPVSV